MGELARPDDARGSPDWFALIGVLVSIVLHVILDAEEPCLPFIVGCSLFWVAYVVVRWRQDRHILREWGFRTDNLLAASLLPLLFLGAVALALAAYGASRGTLRFPAHAVLLLLLYPLWGLVQQFLALGIVAGNLEKVPALRARRWLIVLLTAGIFSLVHINDWRVMLATLGLQLVFVPLYFRDRNVFPLAVVHGWLGALFYLWVLGIDLWDETFGST
jgi:hypothetical protein